MLGYLVTLWRTRDRLGESRSGTTGREMWSISQHGVMSQTAGLHTDILFQE